LALKEQGRWERTIVVIVGDHGESFGQHEIFTHGNDSHEEQLAAPWIVRVPGASPRAISEATSHVDVLPTLLDVLQIPYEEQLIQGESLLRKERKRKYVFAVGNEKTRTSISEDGFKLQQMLRSDRCRVYDLKTDPEEKTPLSCESRSEQHRALADFSRHQMPTLSAYSQSFWKGETSFGGRKHPKIQAPLSEGEDMRRGRLRSVQ
jgi:membrane-anchored protein YejM (alkaline phosphatase superfamily)